MKKISQKDNTEGIVSITEEDIKDIRNLFTNTISASVQNRSQLRELLDTEETLLDKLKSIQDERNALILEKEVFLNKIKKLEKNVSKGSK